MKSERTFLCAVLTSLFILAGFASAANYNVIDLGTLGGSTSYAMSISNSNQIAGAADNNSGGYNACLFYRTNSGNNKNLGGLVGGVNSEAYHINNNGYIVGYARNSSGKERACLFDKTGGGNNKDLGALGGVWSSASSINDSNQIVGAADDGSSYGRACLFNSTGGANTNLGALGGSESSAYSINNNGLIAGYAMNSNGYKRACLFDRTGDANNNIDLKTLGGLESTAYSINNNGQIVGNAEGYFNSSHYLRACLFDANGGGNNKDLGTFGGYYQNSVAHCINDNGQIVGAVWDSTTFYSPTPYWRACLFDPNGTGNNIDLNSLIDPNSHWILEDAWGINNNGWIVGQGVNPNGQYHAFLLVPEPTTICLLCLGGLSILIRRKT